MGRRSLIVILLVCADFSTEPSTRDEMNFAGLRAQSPDTELWSLQETHCESIFSLEALLFSFHFSFFVFYLFNPVFFSLFSFCLRFFRFFFFF